MTLTFILKYVSRPIKSIFLILLFIGCNYNFAQGCPGIDATFTVSNTSPEVGEEVVFTYNGSLDFCEDCSYYLSYDDVDYGGDPSAHIGGEPGAPVLMGEIIGRHVYRSVGSVTATLIIESVILDCSTTYTIGIDVVAPEEPLAMFTVGSVGLCITDQSHTYEIETVGDDGYTITNVAWNMGDSPDLINTAGLELTHEYIGTGETYYIVVVVSFYDGFETIEKTVVNIVNRGGVDDFMGLDSYLRVSVMNGDPQFTPSLSYGMGGANVDFIYQGSPFPPPVLDEELGWGVVEWGSVFTLDVPTPITTIYDYEIGDQIVTTQPVSTGWHTAILYIYWDTSGPTQCSNADTVEFYVPEVSCDSCNSFKPQGGKRYWMSAWVKVDEGQVKSYNPDGNATGDAIDPEEMEDAYIEFFFAGPNTSAYFFPTGEIIDGWQRVVGEFTIPVGTLDFDVNLYADLNSDTYFDDIRIHPFNGSMKSYVYDGETFWLTSELDDNNYATFYEYDQEGGLIRIKKETSRGIVTIQETKSSTVKD